MITVRIKNGRMHITGHADIWVCAAMTMLAQSCVGWTKDKKAKARKGMSGVKLPTGKVGKFVLMCLDGLTSMPVGRGKKAKPEVRVIR